MLATHVIHVVAQCLLKRENPMQAFDPLPPLIGGALIGLAASVFLLGNGRIAGISGIVGGAFVANAKDRVERLLFVGGLLISGAIVFFLRPASFPASNSVPVVPAIIAGLLVGFGTRLGNGCTSGHGVCGLSRLSIRSLVATVTFMVAAGITVFVSRHVLGSAP